MIKNLEQYPIVNEVLWDKHGLIGFEKTIADHWEAGRINGPVHLRGGEREDIELYIEGWEAARIANYNNPYHDILTNRPERWNRGWNRGWSAWWDRRGGRTRVYTERDMEYYHTEDFLFFDVSEVRYNMVDESPYKVMLFRSIEEGNTVEGQTIYPTDYMYNFPDVI